MQLGGVTERHFKNLAYNVTVWGTFHLRMYPGHLNSKKLGGTCQKFSGVDFFFLLHPYMTLAFLPTLCGCSNDTISCMARICHGINPR